ncbi:MAG: hypothetical protein AB1422_04660 [bacterium]
MNTNTKRFVVRGCSLTSGKPKGEPKGSHYIYGMSEVNSCAFLANSLNSL